MVLLHRLADLVSRAQNDKRQVVVMVVSPDRGIGLFERDGVDAAEISVYRVAAQTVQFDVSNFGGQLIDGLQVPGGIETLHVRRSEEHTSELQSLRHLVCRLL